MSVTLFLVVAFAPLAWSLVVSGEAQRAVHVDRNSGRVRLVTQKPRSARGPFDRRPLEDQWASAVGVVAASVSRTSDVAKAQADAVRQIEAAEYALDRMMDDLSAYMVLPAKGAARSEHGYRAARLDTRIAA